MYVYVCVYICAVCMYVCMYIIYVHTVYTIHKYVHKYICVSSEDLSLLRRDRAVFMKERGLKKRSDF